MLKTYKEIVILDYPCKEICRGNVEFILLCNDDDKDVITANVSHDKIITVGVI